MHMNRRAFLKHSSLLGATAALGLGGVLRPGTARAAEFWDMANEYNPTSYQGMVDQKYADLLAKHSNGAISVTVHSGGALGYKSLDQFDAVGDGAIQLADTLMTQLGGINQIFNLSSLPFIAQTVKDARLLFDIARPSYETLFNASGQTMVYALPNIPSGIWSKKPIHSMEDLAGLRIRTYDANGTLAMRAAGAAPIQLSWGDIIPQLSTGGIDAILTSAESGGLLSLWEYLSHFNEINYSMPLHVGHMNLDTMTGLSSDLKDAVAASNEEIMAYIWSSQGDRVEKAYANCREKGVTIVNDMPADFMKALRKAGKAPITEWMESTGAEGKALIDAFDSQRS